MHDQNAKCQNQDGGEIRAGLLPSMGCIGMCGPKGCGFSTALVINRVSILTDFGYFIHEEGMVFLL